MGLLYPETREDTSPIVAHDGLPLCYATIAVSLDSLPRRMIQRRGS